MSKLSKHASSGVKKQPNPAEIDDLRRQLQERTEQVEALLREHALLQADVSLLEKERRRLEFCQTAVEGQATAPQSSIPVAAPPQGNSGEIVGVLDRMRQEYADLRQRADKAEADYQSVVTSTCWRITKPIRFARKIFG